MKKRTLNKQTILILLLVLYSMALPYLTIFTLKYPNFLNGYLDFGTLLLSFLPMLIGDLLTECFGAKKAIAFSSIIYAFQLFFILALNGICHIPGLCLGFGDIAEDITFGFDIIFSAQWRITIASAVAYYCGIISNSLIMSYMKKRTKNDNTFWFFARCILSTILGQLLDNGIFFVLAMAPVGLDATSELPWNLLLTNIFMATGIEVVYEIILFPLTKFLTRKIDALPELC